MKKKNGNAACGDSFPFFADAKNAAKCDKKSGGAK